jgi:hypothetical protein
MPNELLIDSRLAPTVLFRFAGAVFAGDGRLVGEVRRPDAALAQGHYAPAAMAEKRTLTFIRLPGRKFLIVKLSERS